MRQNIIQRLMKLEQCDDEFPAQKKYKTYEAYLNSLTDDDLLDKYVKLSDISKWF